MLEKLKKKSIIKMLPTVIIMFAVGLGLIAIEFSSVKALMRGRVVFESLAPDEINGDLIVDVTLL